MSPPRPQAAPALRDYAQAANAICERQNPFELRDALPARGLMPQSRLASLAAMACQAPRNAEPLLLTLFDHGLSKDAETPSPHGPLSLVELCVESLNWSAALTAARALSQSGSERRGEIAARALPRVARALERVPDGPFGPSPAHAEAIELLFRALIGLCNERSIPLNSIAPPLAPLCANEPNLLRLCLQFGADPNAIDPRGRGALLIACAKGQARSIDLLLDHNAHPSPAPVEDRSPIEALKTAIASMGSLSLTRALPQRLARLEALAKNAPAPAPALNPAARQARRILSKSAPPAAPQPPRTP